MVKNIQFKSKSRKQVQLPVHVLTMPMIILLWRLSLVMSVYQCEDASLDPIKILKNTTLDIIDIIICFLTAWKNEAEYFFIPSFIDFSSYLFILLFGLVPGPWSNVQFTFGSLEKIFLTHSPIPLLSNHRKIEMVHAAALCQIFFSNKICTEKFTDPSTP